MIRQWLSFSLVTILTALPVLTAAGCGSGTADSNNAANNTANNNAVETTQKFTDEQLDNLLAPVALYPDPLLAQMLPAATYPEDIESAAKYLRGNGSEDGIKDQDWDIAVKSVAHYPKVVYQMSDDPDWTTAIGQAYALQPTDVMDSIQRLRLKAKDSGVLASTKEQEVAYNDGNIGIYPAQPQYMYVPQYDPNKVYYQERNSGGGNGLLKTLITFGAGVAVGVWLTNAFDWGGHKVYYNDWRGDDGWRARSRNYYGWDDNYYRNSYYVDDRYRVININRDVLYRPVRYDRVRIYDRIYPGVTYSNRNKSVPGLGDEMRRQDPGRPIEKGPPPGQLKKGKVIEPGGPPNKKLDQKGNGPAKNVGKPDKGKATGPAQNKGGKPDKAGKPAGKNPQKGGGGGKGKKN